MKKKEWIIFVLLITLGLVCLTVSATAVWGTESIERYVKTFIQLFLWIGIPILVIEIIYIVFLKK